MPYNQSGHSNAVLDCKHAKEVNCPRHVNLSPGVQQGLFAEQANQSCLFRARLLAVSGPDLALQDASNLQEEALLAYGVRPE